MRNAFNLVGYQLVWFAAVLGAARGQPWLGPVAVVILGGLHLRTAPRRSDDVCLSVAAVALGFALDGSLSVLGLVQYSGAFSPWPPLWLLAIWAAFGLTLNHSFALSQRHLGISAAVGALGGPLAYLAAERLGAVLLPQPAWQGIAALAVAWSIALPLLAALARGQQHLVRYRISGVQT